SGSRGGDDGAFTPDEGRTRARAGLVAGIGVRRSKARRAVWAIMSHLKETGVSMHPRTAEVLNYLEQTRTELRAAVDAVPPPARNTTPAVDQWSVAQVLDHLAIVHRRVAAVVTKWIAEARANGLAPETATSSVLNTIPTERILDRTRKVPAPEAIIPRSEVDAETAWTELEQS